MPPRPPLSPPPPPRRNMPDVGDDSGGVEATVGGGSVGPYRARGIAEGRRLLRLVGSDVHEEGLAPLADDTLLHVAAHDQEQPDEHVKQHGYDDRYREVSIGPILGQVLQAPCPRLSH